MPEGAALSVYAGDVLCRTSGGAMAIAWNATRGGAEDVIDWHRFGGIGGAGYGVVVSAGDVVDGAATNGA